MPALDLEPLGERAARLVLAPEWATDLGGRAALSRALLEIPGVTDALVGETHALLISGDPAGGGLRGELADALERCRGAPLAAGAAHDVEVIYDGADLDDSARSLGLSTRALIALHCEHPLHVSFVGFLPGFAYLRGLAPELHALPRRASPRPRVPGGSVAIAGGMSAVYPAASPGGWNLLGHAPDFDPFASPLRIGHVVRFHKRLETFSERSRESARENDAPAGAPEHSSHLPSGEARLRIERSTGITLVVDGTPRRALRDGAPPGGPLAPTLARRALAALGSGDGLAILERYGALRVSLRGGGPREIADETGHVTRLRPGESVEVPWSGRSRVGYLAIEGGLDTPDLLGGRGTLLSIGRGGHHGRPLRRGDLLPLGPLDRSEDAAGPLRRVAPESTEDDDGEAVLVFHRGPDLLDIEHTARAIASSTLRIGHASDRTGTRLLADTPLSLRTRDVRSAPVVAGAIQAPPSGELVVLGPDHPITGGYPVIGVLGDATCDALFTRPIGARVRLRVV